MGVFLLLDSVLCATFFNVCYFHIKHQDTVFRNCRVRTAWSVRQRRRNVKSSFTTFLQQGNTFIPSWNNLTGSQREREWFYVVELRINVRIERMTIQSLTCILNGYALASLCSCTSTFFTN